MELLAEIRDPLEETQENKEIRVELEAKAAELRARQEQLLTDKDDALQTENYEIAAKVKQVSGSLPPVDARS